MPSPTEEQVAQVSRLLDNDGKIAAVKYFMECTGVSLAQAKTAVEAIESNSFSGESADAGGRVSDSKQPNLEAVDAAIASGNKLDAVKLYRAATGKSLKESLQFVEDRLESRSDVVPSGTVPHSDHHRVQADNAIQSQRSGCLSVGTRILFLGISAWYAIDWLI